jgi:hypothetical protein
MELQYENAMEEYDLKYNDLPEDAQTGIDNIKDVLKGLAMLEKKGKKASAKTLKKLKAMDKWVYYEILDHVQGTDNNDEEMEVDADEVIEDINQEAKEGSAETNVPDKVGVEIEVELQKMMESGTKEWSIEQVKSVAKKTYNVLFDNYEEGDENGIRTSKYSLIETKPKIFTISKN